MKMAYLILLLYIVHFYYPAFFDIFSLWKSEDRFLFQQRIAEGKHGLIAEFGHLRRLYQQISCRPLDASEKTSVCMMLSGSNAFL